MPRLPAVTFLLLLCLPLASQGQSLESNQIEELEQIILSSDRAVAYDAACQLFRHWRHTPPDYAFHVLIEQFRADDIPGNATTATRLLERWSDTGRAYPESAQQRLWANLNSSDEQMQFLSAHALAANHHVIPDTPLKLRLIEQFRADDFYRTATEAAQAIRRGPIEPIVVEHLEAALSSDDSQQRFFAAATLHNIESYEPSRTFYQVLIDQFGTNRGGANREAAVFILRGQRPLPPVAVELLRGALRSDQWVQRTCAGFLLVSMADAGECELSPDIATYLRDIVFTPPLIRRNELTSMPRHSLYPLNAAPEQAFRYFADHPGFETAWVESHLDDADEVVRFDTARILAIRGDIGRLDRIMEILLANAMIDQRLFNGGEACYALWSLGEAGVPEMNLFVGADIDPQMEFVLQRALRLIREDTEVATLGQMRGGSYRISLPHWWQYSTP